MHDSNFFVSLSTTIRNVVCVLMHYKYEGDLWPRAILQTAIEKLPPNLREKWWFNLNEYNKDWSYILNLFMLFVYEGIPQPPGDRKVNSRRNVNKIKQFFNPRILVQPKNIDHCPLDDSAHIIWTCPVFRNLNVNDRYSIMRKQRFFYGCLERGHAIRDSKGNAFGRNRFTKTHNQFEH